MTTRRKYWLHISSTDQATSQVSTASSPQTARNFGLKEDPHRFLQERNKRGHPLCGRCSVDRPMVDRECEVHDRTHPQPPLGDDGILQRSANGQDGRLWRDDDRSKVLGAEHAEVRDGQCPALELLLLQVP